MQPECILLTEWPLTRPCHCKLCRKMQAGAKACGESLRRKQVEIFLEVLKAEGMYCGT